MNEVTMFALVAGILLLLAFWARSGHARRDAAHAARNAARMAVGSVVQSDGDRPSRTDSNYDLPTRLGDDRTIAPVSNLWLQVVSCRLADGPAAGTQLSLSDGVNAVGRKPTSEPQVHSVPIEADRAVSTDHLYIETAEDGRLLVTDRGSRNGTLLNARRIEPDTPTTINIGDLLTIGNTTLQLGRDGDEALTGVLRLAPVYLFKVLNGPAQGQSWSMNADRFRIGRSRESDWQLPDDKISRVHVEVQREGDQVRVVDQHSSNGLLVNGRSMVSRVLETGDIIRLGDTEIRFEHSLG